MAGSLDETEAVETSSLEDSNAASGEGLLLKNVPESPRLSNCEDSCEEVAASTSVDEIPESSEDGPSTGLSGAGDDDGAASRSPDETPPSVVGSDPTALGHIRAGGEGEHDLVPRCAEEGTCAVRLGAGEDAKCSWKETDPAGSGLAEDFQVLKTEVSRSENADGSRFVAPAQLMQPEVQQPAVETSLPLGSVVATSQDVQALGKQDSCSAHSPQGEVESYHAVSAGKAEEENAVEAISASGKGVEGSVETISASGEGEEDAVEAISASGEGEEEDAVEAISAAVEGEEDGVEAMSAAGEGEELDAVEAISAAVEGEEDGVEAMSAAGEGEELDAVEAISAAVEGEKDAAEAICTAGEGEEEDAAGAICTSGEGGELDAVEAISAAVEGEEEGAVEAISAAVEGEEEDAVGAIPTAVEGEEEDTVEEIYAAGVGHEEDAVEVISTAGKGEEDTFEAISAAVEGDEDAVGATSASGAADDYETWVPRFVAPVDIPGQDDDAEACGSCDEAINISGGDKERPALEGLLFAESGERTDGAAPVLNAQHETDVLGVTGVATGTRSSADVLNLVNPRIHADVVVNPGEEWTSDVNVSPPDATPQDIRPPSHMEEEDWTTLTDDHGTVNQTPAVTGSISVCEPTSVGGLKNGTCAAHLSSGPSTVTLQSGRDCLLWCDQLGTGVIDTSGSVVAGCQTSPPVRSVEGDEGVVATWHHENESTASSDSHSGRMEGPSASVGEPGKTADAPPASGESSRKLVAHAVDEVDPEGAQTPGTDPERRSSWKADEELATPHVTSISSSNDLPAEIIDVEKEFADLDEPACQGSNGNDDYQVNVVSEVATQGSKVAQDELRPAPCRDVIAVPDSKAVGEERDRTGAGWFNSLIDWFAQLCSPTQ
eukprot:TRINITY_DN903_c0_g1_i1.p1 TRINITY_DN903_c0_g1~~TRINITY_DN903_c0_g1_i1.p1  ORF type:complete len:960 (+),score=203.85 TRINITY_DN903_c0_g1_i1:211-2880(+)